MSLSTTLIGSFVLGVRLTDIDLRSLSTWSRSVEVYHFLSRLGLRTSDLDISIDRGSTEALEKPKVSSNSMFEALL